MHLAVTVIVTMDMSPLLLEGWNVKNVTVQAMKKENAITVMVLDSVSNAMVQA